MRQTQVRRILTLAGWSLRFGIAGLSRPSGPGALHFGAEPGPGDHVAVWGRSPYAARGEAVASRSGATLIRLEDAFIRSIRPGRSGDAPIGLLIDPHGVHFDASAPSLVERTILDTPLDDTALLQRARDGIARLRSSNLSKYNDFDPDCAPPAPGYVLVIDQTRGDASITHGGASARTFREMLGVAQIEHPGARIIIKTHPETVAGHRAGHYGHEHCDARTSLLAAPVSPWALLDGAIAVYTVSSQLGYEAILAGHRPRVFGQPFYAGWGLTQDEAYLPRRRRNLTRAQLFAASHLLAPTWYDPAADRLCSFEQAMDQFEAELRAHRADRHGHVATGMSRWKHRHLRAFFGKISFAAVPRPDRPWLHWASKPLPVTDRQPIRVEDGFLRSRGLGARLVPPLSLVTDHSGIYYDPTGPSDLERLIAQPLTPTQAARAERLLDSLRQARLTKYNLGGGLPDLPKGRRILVPGQVEDDASIRLGGGHTVTNLALLTFVRAENPDAVIIFKPHPDVVAGLRPGAVPHDKALRHADAICPDADTLALIEACDSVWTMTSLMGFEALLRGKQVHCLGMPFYAGWGLTRDHAARPDRRRARPSLTQLVHATLIAYPRYHDPVSGRACSPERVIALLAGDALPAQGPLMRLMAMAQRPLKRLHSR